MNQTHLDYTEIDDIWVGFQNCLEWSTMITDEDDEELTSTGDWEYSDAIRYAVLDFILANEHDIILFAGIFDHESVGHTLCLSAGGHGTGFWDRGVRELGDRLHAAAKVYSFDVWVDADGVFHADY